MPAPDLPLWTCDACGRQFANRNQRHACGRHALDPHFAGTDPAVRLIYAAFVAVLESFGPVTIVPEKTRIAFQVRMSFAQLAIPRSWVVGHLVLARRADDPVFTRIEALSPGNIVHHFRLADPAAVARLTGYAREAYEVGCQRHRRR
jgi:hypothetical protein